MSDVIDIPRTRPLGADSVSTLAYGCWRFAGTPLRDAQAKLAAAEDAGINLVDTAAIYGMGETAFGEAEERLGDVFAADPVLRDRLVVVTKAGIEPPTPYDSRPERLIASAEASLRRLKTDRIDVFLVHRPDLLVAHADVAGALDRLVTAGKVRAVGVSNYTPDQTRALAAHLRVPLAATQPEFSARCLDPITDGTLDLAQELSIAPMAWSPLAGGKLATGDGDQTVGRIVAAIDDVAARTGAARDAIALAWVLAHPACPIALVGSQNPDRIRRAAEAYDVPLTRRDWYAILEASRGERMP